MSIVGIGTDLVSVNRISDLYKKSGDKFAYKILSEKEISLKKISINYLAKRFAGKEAIVKALGSGIGKEISFNDISILNNKNGAPFVKISEKSKSYKFLKYKKIHISLSDEKKGYALAFVVIEA